MEETYRQESRLLRAYGALSPNNPNEITFPPKKWLSNLHNQAHLFQLLVLDLPRLTTGSSSSYRILGNSLGHRWKSLFWKKIIDILQNPRDQEEEIDERILTYYISLIQEKHTPSPSSSSKLPTDLKLNQNHQHRGNLDIDIDDDSEIHTYFYGDLDVNRRRWSRINLFENKACISNGTTGLRSWGASVCLANYLLLNRDLLREKYTTVVELGSGTGLLGILAHQVNPNNRVFLTDFHPSVLQRLHLNVYLNVDHELDASCKNNLSVRSLDWNSSGSELSKEDVRSKEGALLILGADVIYDPDLVLGLVLTIKRYLTKPSSSENNTPSSSNSSLALICTIVRNPQTWDLFLHVCRLEGLKMNLIPVEDAVKMGHIDQSGIIFPHSLDRLDFDSFINQFRLVSLKLVHDC